MQNVCSLRTTSANICRGRGGLNVCSLQEKDCFSTPSPFLSVRSSSSSIKTLHDNLQQWCSEADSSIRRSHPRSLAPRDPAALDPPVPAPIHRSNRTKRKPNPQIKTNSSDGSSGDGFSDSGVVARVKSDQNEIWTVASGEFFF
ncbi:hypothetical protein QVD17_19384 [Tagetes erecta]|uniref:Uncharacterized protein n=1 Tax=Tagetes erecta TaxID=13708 RepID=A0AAD8KJG7_TARER|nr:hypothetical protein QVD17_19384 [Tagetes erecta]